MTGNTKLGLAFAGGILLTLVAGYAIVQPREAARSPVPAAPAAGQHAAHAPGSAAAPPTRAPVEKQGGQADGLPLQIAPTGMKDIVEDLTVPVTVVPDESRISHIHTRVSGWIEHLHVSNTGELVRAGQPIADIFSQELLASQIEFLAARNMAGPPSAVAESGRARLKFFGMSDAEIAAIEKSGKPRRVVTLYAPRSGVLAHRGISAGTAVDPSTEIAIVLDLSRVWVLAEVPESGAGSIRKGMQAKLTFGSDGAAPLATRVEFIDPIFTESTRTLKVRFSLPNSAGALRPGMYGTAQFQKPARQALTVPRDAVVDTGASQFVYVVRNDGSYTPRAVKVGARMRDEVEITGGLTVGEKIVTSGVFLLDSESRLRASGGQGTSHGGHGQPATAQQKSHSADGARHD